MQNLHFFSGWMLLLMLSGLSLAQDATTPADKAAAAATSPETAEAEEPTTGDAAKAWKASLAEWKGVLVGLRQLRDKYQIAEEDELEGIRAEYNQLLAKGETMLPKLRETATAAFAEAPNEDRQLIRFLMKLVEDDVKADRYESAYTLAQTLIENGIEDKSIHNLAGIAAFSTNRFNEAKDLLAQAQESGTLIRTEQHDSITMNNDVSKVIKLWQEELKFREAEATADDLPRVKLTTNEGDIVVELFENEAPDTVGNFISLVENGFYDGRIFHRVLTGFMAQTGCPKGNGTGGPGYNIYCECYETPHRKHFAGSLSMAHGGKDTGGSQFYVTFRPTTHLNGKHTVFGRVIEGWDVLSKIERIRPGSRQPQGQPDKIVSAEVLRKRDHEYKPNKVK